MLVTGAVTLQIRFFGFFFFLPRWAIFRRVFVLAGSEPCGLARSAEVGWSADEQSMRFAPEIVKTFWVVSRRSPALESP